MRAYLRVLIACLPFEIAVVFIASLYLKQTVILPELGFFATAFALGFGSLSLSLTGYNRLVIKPRFVQVSLRAVGKVSDKKYRVVAEVMNIGGGSADKCMCEVMRIVDGKKESLLEKIHLDFVPVDTPVGKLDPLFGSSTFSMFPSTRILLRNYIPECLRVKGKRNLKLKLEANGCVAWSHEFGLPDWASLSDAQKRAQVPNLNVL